MAKRKAKVYRTCIQVLDDYAGTEIVDRVVGRKKFNSKKEALEAAKKLCLRDMKKYMTENDEMEECTDDHGTYFTHDSGQTAYFIIEDCR